MQLLQEQPKRMMRELRLLRECAESLPGLTLQGWSAPNAGELCMQFSLQLSSSAFRGVLVYPDLFPDVPAFIRPQDPGEHWSSHQYGGSGVLCLQYGPDNWHAGITGQDLILSAARLLWTEDLIKKDVSLEPVPSRHTSTTGQSLRGKNRFLSTAGLRRALEAAGGSSIPMRVVATFAEGRSIVVPIALGDPSVLIPDVPKAFDNEYSGISGWTMSVPSVLALEKIQDVSSLKAVLGPSWPWQGELDDRLYALLVHDSVGAMNMFVFYDGTTPSFTRYENFECDVDITQRLPTEFSKLVNFTVAIIGLGSLGSKIAISLARAGVGNFVLVDDDVVGAHNIVRNELTWLDVGFSKVHAVARALRRVATSISIESYTIRYGGQENPQLSASLGSVLAKCNLVIDATANTQAFVALAALAKRGKLAMIWGEVFAGGVGAMMARSRPDLDADPLNIRAHIHGVLEGMAPRPNGEAFAYGLEADNRVYVASDADVSALAASMTQFALDTLCAERGSIYTVAAYLMGYQCSWEFKGPFDTIPIDCNSAQQVSTESEALTFEEAEELNGLIKSLGAECCE